MRDHRNGQSLIEILVAIGVGTIMLLGAITALAPVIKSSTDVNQSQIGAALGKELLDNLKVFAEANWHNIDSLATTSANKYFLSMATSGFAGTWSYPSDINPGIDTILIDGFPTGTIGYWKMNDVLGSVYPVDFSGYRNILLANSSWPVSTSAQYGAGFYFDGSAHYLYTSGPLPASSDYTFMSWLKTTGTSTVVYSNRRGGGSLILGVDSNGREYVTDSACSSSTITSLALNDNKFHQVAYVRSSSSATRSLYLDGVLSATDSVTGCSAIDKVLDIAHDQSPNVYFTGILDESRVFNRALGASEIKSIYNGYTFFRDFYVNDVYRNPDGSLASIGGGLDPSTKKITVEYYWGSVAPKTLTVYLTRSGDKTLWQTDWSGGAGVNGPASSTGSSYATSSNIDVTTSNGSIRINGL